MGDQGFTVKAPSMINNHHQAESPLAPFRPPVIPAAMRPENAPERRDQEYITAVRLARLFFSGYSSETITNMEAPPAVDGNLLSSYLPHEPHSRTHVFVQGRIALTINPSTRMNFKGRLVEQILSTISTTL
jgi:hypothetical protein